MSAAGSNPAPSARLLSRRRKGADVADRHDADQQRLAVALDTAGIGSWELDLGGGELRGDARLLELCGFPADSSETRSGEFPRRLPRPHRERVERSLERCIAEGCDY